ncbi:helix-turn-helix domain-containing protein [Vagococcus sp.]|uniref:helix-turn-helix domain-containing protein n=1 Tax=Vagococcus sp. TaxID=1933889 RepID=UPI003F99F4D1
MNIERFIERRKELGLSQVELALGICTQATLSRFENNGQVPSLKILIKLCDRLGLPLGNLFPRVGIKNAEVIKKMHKIEYHLMSADYKKAKQNLEQLDVKQIQEAGEILHYLYLKGFLMCFLNDDITNTLFTFDKLLLDPSMKEIDVFRLLAYTGIGTVYSKQEELEKAEYYFNKVVAEIYYFPTKELVDTWRVLQMVLACGIFYAKMREYEASNTLLKYAFSICADNRVTYCLDEIAFQLAENSIQQKRSSATIIEKLHDARAYAKLNRNQPLLEMISKIESDSLKNQTTSEL